MASDSRSGSSEHISDREENTASDSSSDTPDRSFRPPPVSAEPLTVFSPNLHAGKIPSLRYIRNDNPRECLVFIIGRALEPELKRAGYGVQWGPDKTCNTWCERLEGPGPQTSYRAEIRAAIVALGGLLDWLEEGFDTLVVSSRSRLLVEAACGSAQRWKENGWRLGNRTEPSNRDLWETLLALLAEWDRKGLHVKFWKGLPGTNMEIDGLGIKGARKDEVPQMLKVCAVDQPDGGPTVFNLLPAVAIPPPTPTPPPPPTSQRITPPPPPLHPPPAPPSRRPFPSLPLRARHETPRPR
ncbi:MAG: hypothetical protein Q9210_007290 [Variospora velana]